MKNTTNIGNSASQCQSSSDDGNPKRVPSPVDCAVTIVVGHHLRRRAQAAQERILRVRRPAAHDDPIDAKRRDGEDVEDADVEVRDHPIRRAPAEDRAAVHGDDGPGRQRQNRSHQRRQQKHALVGAGRDDRLLDQEFGQVGERLQQAERADHVRTAAQMHGCPHLAVEQDQERDDDQQRDQ
jgi:hypothetical protein